MISEEKKKIVINNYFKELCTVDTTVREAFTKGFELGIKKAPRRPADEQRIKGQWIRTQNPQWPAYWHEKCSICGWWNTKDATPGPRMKPRDFMYCPKCGAKMEGAYNENR